MVAGPGANVGGDELALFSEGEMVTGGTCDMTEVDNCLSPWCSLLWSTLVIHQIELMYD